MITALLLLATFVPFVASNAPAATASPGVVSIPIAGHSYGAVYDSAKGEVFVSTNEADSLSIISDTTNAVVATVSVGAGPAGLAYDSAKGEIFVGNNEIGSGAGTVAVVSDKTNSVVTTVSVGNQPDALAYDSAKGEVFVANTQDGTVSVINDGTNAVVATVSAGSGPVALAYDSAKGEIFVTDIMGSSVSVISDATNAIVTTVSVGTQPDGIAYDSAKGEIFVANAGFGSSTVSVISDATNAVVATVNVGTYALGVAYISTSGEILVANEGDGTVSVISDATNSVTSTSSVAAGPTGFAYDASKGEVFVVYSNANIVTMIPGDVSTVTITKSTSSTTTYSATTFSTSTVACTTSPRSAPSTSSAGVGAWAPSNCYPDAITGPSCAVSGGYIFCVGGSDSSGPSNAVYYAAVSAAGVGPWMATGAGYPSVITGTSCAISGGYIYCVGGDTASQTYGMTYTVWYAPVSSTGVGTWAETTNYPSVIESESCSTSGGYIYCVGGFNPVVQDSANSALGTTNNVYFAPVSPTGVGAWTATTSYPAFDEDQSCVTSGGFMFCVGGFTVTVYSGSPTATATSTYSPGVLSAVYFAPVSPTGVGAWTNTTRYPTEIFVQSCAVSGGDIYCVGGDTIATGTGPTGAVYYASLSSAGTGAWTPTTSYPTNIEAQSCAISGGYVYCVGGDVNSAETDAVCYAQVGTSGSPDTGEVQGSSCSSPSSASSASQASKSTASSSSSTSLPPSYLGVVAVDVLVFLAVFMLRVGRRLKKET